MDISALIFKILNKVFWELFRIFFSILMRTILLLKGVNFGRKNNFYGLATIIRLPNTKIQIGNNVTIRSKSNSNLIGINRRCIFSAHLKGASLIIGNNCGFSGTTIGAFEKIQLGNNVRCGANTTITDSDWHLDDPRAGKPKPVYIEDNVWLGVNSIILKGVRIGKNSVIGANSVVTSDIPENVIAAGNPCKVIKEISL